MRRSWISLVVGVSVALATSCGSPPPAQAPSSPQEKTRNIGAAELLFDEAIALEEAGKYAEACAKFEESDSLDHAPNTLFNLADCYEKIGRFASAWEAFAKVADEARQAGKAALKEEALKRAEPLKPRLSKLTIVVPPAVSGIPGLTVKRNGTVVERALWNQSVPVDAGEQAVVVTAPGKSAWREAVAVKEAGSASVSVPELEKAGLSGQRVGALAAGGAGVAGVLVGGIFGALAFSKWGEAVDACAGPESASTVCPTATQAERAASLGDTASTLGMVSNLGFAVGGAGLVAAGVLWFTASSEDSSVSASTPPRIAVTPLGPSGLGGSVRGTF